VREGSPAAVTVWGDPDERDLVRTRVDGDVLIGPANPTRTNQGIRVSVTAPERVSIGLAGSGRVKAECGASSRDSSLSVTGSGTLWWKGTAGALATSISGSGALRAELEASLSGSGSLAYRGTAKAAGPSLAGSGKAKLAGQGESLRASTAG